MPVPTEPADETDESLLAAYGRGERLAARTLAARLVPPVFGFAMRMLDDRAEAEDVVQEAMLRLWKQAPHWRSGEAKVSTWLYRVVSNLCTDRLRARRNAARPGLDGIAEPADPAPGALAAMTDAQRQAALQEALARLPARQRQAVVLRHIEGLANPEIAAVMQISTEAVESLTARGKRALKAILSGRKEELGYADD